jgi:hypothetical protein
VSEQTTHALVVLGVVFGSIFAYCVLIGVTFALLPNDWCDDPVIPYAAAFLWPVVLPAMLGKAIVARFSSAKIPTAKARDRSHL